MSNNRNKFIAIAVVLAVLAAAFWFGGSAPGSKGWKIGDSAGAQTAGQTEVPSSAVPVAPPDDAAGTEAAEPAPSVEGITEQPQQAGVEGPAGSGGAQETTGAPDTQTDPANAQPEEPALPNVITIELEAPGAEGASAAGSESPQTAPQPVEPQNAVVTETAHTCTISIECGTILEHMDWLDPEKVELVPDGGVILPPTEVTFYEGESVFNVLQRTCKQNRIHMEFSNTPMYNSAYIEGIHNLYEFDCGELSGWMYSVNGWYPNYGCSRYALSDGDVVCWRYTCDLGYDIGGGYAGGN